MGEVIRLATDYQGKEKWRYQSCCGFGDEKLQRSYSSVLLKGRWGCMAFVLEIFFFNYVVCPTYILNVQPGFDIGRYQVSDERSRAGYWICESWSKHGVWDHEGRWLSKENNIRMLNTLNIERECSWIPKNSLKRKQ